MKLKLIKFKDLETIEGKSFWIIAPTIAILGVISLCTAGSYENIWPSVVLAVVCIVIPGILMIWANKSKNFHVAYPLLCISFGAISIPLTFLFNGGFLSGMPLFCVISTVITALTYDPKMRFVSLASCIAGNTAAFCYVYFLGAPFPLAGTEPLLAMSEEIKNYYHDIFFSYYACSIGLFFVLNIITGDIRRYKFNQDALQQFFDIEKRKEILQKAVSDKLSDRSEHKNACILFADISNFTPISEKLSSDLVSEFLNDFFSTAGKYIHNTGGIIDKYIGDCIMAYWIDKEGENCVLNAVEAMLNLRLEIFRNAEMINQKYGIELNFSVGIAYGDVIFGDIGSDTMHDYTVIGDAVNTASRIQDYAVSGEMLISDAAAEKIKGAIKMESVENDHFFKGKNRPIDLYRIIGLADKNEKDTIVNKTDYEYKLHVCGCRGSFPVSGLRFSEYGGETSCYVIKKDDYAVIIDCGTGLKNAMKIIDGCSHVDILLTHVHYDHILGFLMSKFPLNCKIRVFGRFNIWNKETNILSDFMEHPYWPVEIVDTDKIDVPLEEDIKLDKNIVASFYNSDHPDNACVIKLMCGDKKVVFLADCEKANSLPNEISVDSDLVFFDGMFDEEDEISHKGWGHGTWQDGVNFQKDKNIKHLVITHHNPENGDRTLMLKEEKAKKLANNVSFAKSGDIFNI